MYFEIGLIKGSAEDASCRKASQSNLCLIENILVKLTQENVAIKVKLQSPLRILQSVWVRTFFYVVLAN